MPLCRPGHLASSCRAGGPRPRSGRGGRKDVGGGEASRAGSRAVTAILHAHINASFAKAVARWCATARGGYCAPTILECLDGPCTVRRDLSGRAAMHREGSYLCTRARPVDSTT